MSSIDRLRYYDGEFLRAFDFGDEQTYHMAMRRRINRYLHLHGIVQGLQLSEDVQATIYEVSILPGLAIDAFGREIYVFVPYTLGDADITANRIPASGGLYDVWLRYSKSPQTPPSSGYGNCNQVNQYTRWVESFNVVLLPSPSSPFTAPAFTDEDSDDPSQDQVGVLLGTVSVNPGSVTKQFSSPVFHHRHFLGVVAQRIQTPQGYDATQASPPFNFQNKNSPHSPAVSLAIEPNIFAKQNLIVGSDFDINKTPGGATIKVNPKPTTSASGSTKLAGDLFVQGNIYSSVPDSGGNPQWLGIAPNVQQLMQQQTPDFVTTTVPVAVTPPNPAPSTGSFMVTAPAITIPSKLAAMSSVVVASASIAGFEFNTPVNINGVGIYINNIVGSPGANQCSVSVTYTMTGTTAGAAPPIISFYLCASAICFPKT